MTESCVHKNPLQREGTAQSQRVLEALLPANVKVHELGPKDWLAFAKDYATLINYYDLADAQAPADDWDRFFPEKDQIDALLQSASQGDTQPHLALFIAFLKLLAYPGKSLNRIPRRHLDFYYGKVLRIDHLPFQPDSVHVLFELAKNASSELVAQDSGLEAGKDAEGNPRTYALEDDLVVNPAKVAAIKSVYLDAGGTLRYAAKTNTKDGLEEALEGDLTWSAFGDDQWPAAPIEAMLAGDILEMAEGTRTITTTWTFSKNFAYVGSVQAYLTGEKGWLGPFDVTISGTKNEIWKVVVPGDEKGIVPYQEDLHLAKADTDKPVIRFTFQNPATYDPGRQVTVSGVTVATEVSGVKQLIINNELGLQAPDKPFMPFGPRPKKNSALKVECKELEGKDVKRFELEMPWLNLPANFTDHYSLYEDAIKAQEEAAQNNFGYVIGYWSAPLESGTGSSTWDVLLADIYGISVDADPMREEYKLQVKAPYIGSPVEQAMFSPSQPIVSVAATETYTKGGVIELRLLKSFYHDLYAPLYVSIITKAGTAGVEADALPPEPYTPFLDSLSLNYEAEASITLSASSVDSDELVFLHVEPFGTVPQQARNTLFPQYLTNQLFVGLENVAPRDNVAILFQVAEGSENPDNSTFAPGEAIIWSVLDKKDNWLKLEEADIVRNTTNNFLQPGIVEVGFPEETSDQHFRLDDELTWLRIELPKAPDSVSRFVGIHAQAATATFQDNGNSHEHLASGLPPKTIAQLSQRKSKIKGVSQPYTSFDGKPRESSADYYRRVSERLRHKDRALTIWDYERLVLQEFPKIYKVKCLNHTRVVGNTVEEISPGTVSLVVIPRLTDANTAYRLKPKVSQNTRDEIKAFLGARHGLHVQLDVHNPFYEEVQFTFAVKFLAGKDYNYHRSLIQDDITRFLAPWAFEDGADIAFDNRLYTYDMLNYLENLSYVDYIEDFSMAHRPVGGSWEVKKVINPSHSMAVLVPAESHNISEAASC